MGRKLVHIISDHQAGGLGVGAAVSTLLANLPDGWDYLVSSVYNYDTISTGYLLGQFALQQDDLRPSELFFYVNCSPRSDRPKDSQGNEQDEFLYLKLRNGVQVLGENSGYTLAFVRGQISEARKVELGKRSAHPRPRAFAPFIIGEILKGHKDCLGDEVSAADLIQDYPQGVIGYIDNFGNIKTTYRDHDEVIKRVKTQGAGARIKVEINGEVRAANLVLSAANLLEGDMTFAPENSPYLNRFWEISCRRGDAAAMFNNPVPGSAIKLMIHQK